MSLDWTYVEAERTLKIKQTQRASKELLVEDEWLSKRLRGRAWRQVKEMILIPEERGPLLHSC